MSARSGQLRGKEIAGIIIGSLMLTSAYAQPVPAEYDEVLKILDKKGDFKSNVLKVSIPRNDLKVTVDGAPTPTAFGFGGWLAITKSAGGTDVMMGDLVLTEDEVNPVMSALLDHGLEVTALHNHFFFEQPRLFYMHVMGHGAPADLARMAKPAVDLIGHVRSSHAVSAMSPSASVKAGTLDTAKIAKIAGHDGEQSGDVYKITVGRDDLNMKKMGAVINARMGLNTWAAFFGSDQQAVIAGDVAMLEGEVNPVLKALRKNGLDVVAIHQHMIGSRPAIIFLHYWGMGPTEKLASGFRAALDVLGKRSAPARPDH